LRPFQAEPHWGGLCDARGDEMAPARLAGHFSPMQEKQAEPLAGENNIHLGRRGMETFARSWPQISIR